MDETDTGGTEVTITRMSLRRGSWVGYTDEAIYVDRDGQKVKIPHDVVTEVALRTLEWDLAVMSLLLVGVGGFVTLTRNPLAGVAFVAVGVASLYWTYAKRYELVIRAENEPKPLRIYPSHPGECHETLVDHVERNRPEEVVDR